MIGPWRTLPVCGARPNGPVLRGGSWNNNARNARAAYRNHNRPDNFNNNRGIRLVLAASDDSGRSGRQTRACPGDEAMTSVTILF